MRSLLLMCSLLAMVVGCPFSMSAAEDSPSEGAGTRQPAPFVLPKEKHGAATETNSAPPENHPALDEGAVDQKKNSASDAPKSADHSERAAAPAERSPAHAQLPAPEQSTAVESNSEAVATALARRLSLEVPASPNLLPETTNNNAQLATLQLKMDLGRTFRKTKDYAQAELNFLYVLDNNGPDEMKKSALLELAGMAEEQKQFVRAQQIYSRWLRKFPEDPGAPEVMLRQGLAYRELGATSMALAKFYSVMSSALSLKLDRLDYYKKLVLRAQTEVAETYYLAGRYAEAVDFFNRVLKLDTPDLNRPVIIYKLVRSLSHLEKNTEVVAKADQFLNTYPDAPQEAEVRFLLATALKKLGRNSESLQQVTLLLKSQEKLAGKYPGNWKYWQQRTGNEIANQLYLEGDYLDALTVYSSLADLDSSPAWQIPAWYQVGLVYEQLKQPEKAGEIYAKIGVRAKDLDTATLSPGLATVIEMAKWRQTRLDWQAKAEKVEQSFRSAVVDPNKAMQ